MKEMPSRLKDDIIDDDTDIRILDRYQVSLLIGECKRAAELYVHVNDDFTSKAAEVGKR